MELAIDTATERASPALAREGVALATVSWPCAQNHSRELLPALERLLGMGGTRLGDVSALVVVTGPGSYNALRVGLATAKGLAFALGIPIVGVPTLEAEAYPYALTRLPICPMLRSGRDQVAWALFQLVEQGWAKQCEERITTVPELLAQVEPQTLLCGPATSMLLGQAAAGTLRPEAACRAAVAAELGWQRLSRGEQDDPATLQPLYLRPPAITTPKSSQSRKDS